MIKHIVVPILGVIAMIPAFISVVGGVTIPIINLELAALVEPYVWVPPLVAIWMIAGLVIGLFLRMQRPAALRTIGQAMGETEGDMAPPPRA